MSGRVEGVWKAGWWAGEGSARRVLALLGAVVVAGHVLSLDAVGVALVWQEAVGRAAGVGASWGERAALGLAVMAVYGVDRQLDARRLDASATMTLRHRLHQQYGRALARVAVGAGVGAVVVGLTAVPGRTVEVGMVLGAVCGAYMWLVQRRPGWMGGGAKEACVGAVFAMGCGAHAIGAWWDRAGGTGGTASAGVGASVGLMAGLFAGNCLLIGRWERREDAAQGLPALGEDGRSTRAWLWGLAGAAVLWGVVGDLTGRPGRTGLGVSVAMACVLLVWLDRPGGRWRGWGGGVWRRIGADAVLLTPLLPLGIMWVGASSGEGLRGLAARVVEAGVLSGVLSVVRGGWGDERRV